MSIISYNIYICKMKFNYESIIVGNSSSSLVPPPPLLKCCCVVLVPYRPQHVERYHRWMLNPDLLSATASEPLTLSEEYTMQQSWYDDDCKCTCIVLSRERLHLSSMMSTIFQERPQQWNNSNHNNHHDDNCTDLDDERNDWLEQLMERMYSNNNKNDDDEEGENDFIIQSLDAMVGDVNLFLSNFEKDDDDDDDEPTLDDTCQNSIGTHHPAVLLESVAPCPMYQQAEIDIMIAEIDARNHGCGYAAVVLMMLYGADHLNITRYFCKIHETNASSIHLFQTKLHFVPCNYAECFREMEYEFVALTPAEMVQKIRTTIVQLPLSSSSPSLIRILPCPLVKR
jgi:RimJ/RimL family protein N-acetyltransferase